jgi:hypothetical protein
MKTFTKRVGCWWLLAASALVSVSASGCGADEESSDPTDTLDGGYYQFPLSFDVPPPGPYAVELCLSTLCIDPILEPGPPHTSEEQLLSRDEIDVYSYTEGLSVQSPTLFVKAGPSNTIGKILIHGEAWVVPEYEGPMIGESLVLTARTEDGELLGTESLTFTEDWNGPPNGPCKVNCPPAPGPTGL